MVFNSIDFAIFLPLIFLLFWYCSPKTLNIQNTIIIISSYFFYGWWDWRFLSLICISTIIDFSIGILLSKSIFQSYRKTLLLVSILFNVGFLGFFKYYNFFIENFINVFTFFGNPIEVGSLKIILPVGISFYTFQTLSYTIDVYRKKIEPTKNFLSFAAFVCFFPQLVAGPIERASVFLIQFSSVKSFNYRQALSGMKLILWGFFKKVVVADTCAIFSDQIFNNSSDLNGSTLLLGAFYFSIQIYGDFSGYSDIAIGVSKLFGFELKSNFKNPYFSRDIAEFWRRWHISLSTWFRDYIYIPLGGSRVSTLLKIRNTLIIFVTSGLWHGANWTFVFWGILNALYFLPSLIQKKNRIHLGIISKGRTLPSLKDISSILTTYILVIIAWVPFRSETLDQAISIYKEIFSFSIFSTPTLGDSRLRLLALFYVLLMFSIEWISRTSTNPLEFITQDIKRRIRWPIYIFFSVSILLFSGKDSSFIYFQF